MRDRFPFLFIGGLLLLGFVGSFLWRGAKRGGFADVLSTYRAEPDGARGLFLLAQESGLPVDRSRTDLTIIDPNAAIALVGVEMSDRELTEEKIEDIFGKPDAGEAEQEPETRQGWAAMNSARVSSDEREKLLEHVKKGHTLVYVPYGSSKDPLLDALNVHVWKAEKAVGIRTLVPAQPSPYTVGVERLEAKVRAFYGLPNDGVPLLVDQYTLNIVGAVVPYGQGQVVILGAPELAMNTALSRADNAQFWLSTLTAAAGAGSVVFDEFHHGFSDDRSIAEFARRYGLHLAAAQLLLGLCLWAAALRRFGKPRQPPEDERVGAIDALFAQSRLYREGKHQAFAAQLLLTGLVQELSTFAGESPRAEAGKVVASLESRGRSDLARALSDVVVQAAAVRSESDLVHVAELAARARQRSRVRVVSLAQKQKKEAA